jgi:MerR family redox-sensitive transcriptional activator SoxR
MVVDEAWLMSSLSIGEVARRSGKPASAIRYYEAIGLIPSAARVSGKRRYDPEVVRTLAVIDTAQRAGLTLAEIRELLDGTPLRELASRKLPALRHAVAWLEHAERCGCAAIDACALFRGLSP